MFGQYGFFDEDGECVIEPQYAFAYDFTNGLAAVNLNRTWYRAENGHRYYENHYGYIDSKGKTVIGFQYDEAYPFNKYGVAVVSDLNDYYYLIDKCGKEIPGSRFEYISPYYDYTMRFFEFSYDSSDDNALVGIYDTKERKVLMEPMVDSITEYEEDFILVYERNGEFGVSDFNQYYINSKGETLHPWLRDKGFTIVEKPDKNKVTGVAVSKYIELPGNPNSYFPYNGKKYERKFIYGLYSSKEKFILLMEYDRMDRLSDDIWSCYKDGLIVVVKTEIDD